MVPTSCKIESTYVESILSPQMGSKVTFEAASNGPPQMGQFMLKSAMQHKIPSAPQHNTKFPQILQTKNCLCHHYYQSTSRRCCWCLRSDNDGENDGKDNDDGGWWRRGWWWTMMARMMTIVLHDDNDDNQRMTTINNDCIVRCREDSHTCVKWVISSLSLSAGFCVLGCGRIFGE